MKRVRLVLLLMSALCALSAPAFAQGSPLLGRLSRQSPTVLDVLKRAGCDAGWLSEALRQSNIKASALRKLPMGQPVFLKAGSCRRKSSAVTASLSASVIEAERARRERAALQAELREAKDALQAAEVDKVKLQAKVDSLTPHPAPPAPEPAPLPPSFPLETVAAVAIGALALGLLASYFFFASRVKGRISFPKVWEIREKGETHRFRLVGVSETQPGSGELIGKYSCPSCPEKNLFGRERNLRTHLRDKCTNRLIYVDVHESLREPMRS